MENFYVCMPGVMKNVYLYSAHELLNILSLVFCSLDPCHEIDLKNTTGRDLFQKSVIDEHCKAILHYRIFGGERPRIAPYWQVVIRVRLHFAIDTMRRYETESPDWEIPLNAVELVDYLHKLLTLFWYVDGFQWLILQRAKLPLITH